MLGYTIPALLKEIVEYDLTQAVFEYATAERISAEAEKQNKIAKIHIKLDTGMGRIGYLDNEIAMRDITKIKKLKNVYVEGIFSHFATADEKNKDFTFSQIEKYVNIIDKLEKLGLILKLSILQIVLLYLICQKPILTE